MINTAPAEYICRFDSSDIPLTTTAWTLTSPNATVWGPSVTTAGVVSFTDGAAAGSSVIFVGLDGNKWTPSISNGGVVTVTSGGALSSNDTAAAVTDSNSIAWMFFVNDNNEVCVTTASVLPGLLRYPALKVTYTPSGNTDLWVLHSARLNLTIRRRSS